MIRSMTGYAAAAADSPRGTLSLELRSVNARFLDLQFRVAEELRSLEPRLRDLILARVARGKIDCRVFLNDKDVPQRPQRLNAEAIARLRSLAAEAQKTFPDAAPLRVADVLRWPGVVAEPEGDEELERLRAHLAEAERTLKQGGAVGKRLDFIAQELNREANTLASKAASQPLSDCALELKVLVEQIREQVQNIE